MFKLVQEHFHAALASLEKQLVYGCRAHRLGRLNIVIAIRLRAPVPSL
jgi:hypothetical protein